MTDILQSEKGAAMVVVALLMVTLLIVAALVIDVGQLYVTRARLQAAADAAALAGATTFFEDNDETQAARDAQNYVSANIEAPCDFTYEANANTRIFSVVLTKEVHFFFGPAIGVNSSKVKATASAAASIVISTHGVVPFGVEQQEFEFGEQYTLKYGAGDRPVHGGNFGALALGGKGANVYRNNIKYGFDGEIKVGDRLTTEPGNMAGPTDDGINFRIRQCTHGCSYATQIEAN